MLKRFSDNEHGYPLPTSLPLVETLVRMAYTLDGKYNKVFIDVTNLFQ